MPIGLASMAFRRPFGNFPFVMSESCHQFGDVASIQIGDKFACIVTSLVTYIANDPDILALKDENL